MPPTARRATRESRSGRGLRKRENTRARLREAADGQPVDAGELVACAARAGLRSSGGAPDPDQPVRALSTLLVDGLITTDDDGVSYRLP
mgnify:FL=1